METDWKKIREEYIATDITLEKLSKKHKIPKSTLYKKSSAGKWNLKKKEFGRKVEEKFTEKASERISTQDVGKLDRLIRSADRMSEIIEEALEDEKQFKRYIVQKKVKAGDNEIMETEEKVFEKFDSRAIKDMTLSLKELTALIRGLNGIPEEIQNKDEKQIVIRIDGGLEE